MPEHQYHAQIKSSLDAIKAAQAHAFSELAVMDSVKLRINAQLEQSIRFLSGFIGEPVTEMPKKKFGEIDISVLKASTSEDVTAKTPKEIAGEELQDDVEEIYPGFIGRNTDEILDSLTDLQIRGVAIKAGMPVTELSPEKIDWDFVEKIKDAIEQKDTIAAINEQSTSAIDDEATDGVIDPEAKAQAKTTKKKKS